MGNKIHKEHGTYGTLYGRQMFGVHLLSSFSRNIARGTATSESCKTEQAAEAGALISAKLTPLPVSDITRRYRETKTYAPNAMEARGILENAYHKQCYLCIGIITVVVNCGEI